MAIHAASETQDCAPKPELLTVLRSLDHRTNGKGIRSLASLLASHNLAAEAVCDPNLSREESVALAREALAADPAFESKLLQILTQSLSDPSAEARALLRAMDLVSELCEGVRALPALRRMRRHPNKELRAKAALTVSREEKSLEWVEKGLSDDDPRMRANAVEALLNLDAKDVERLLKKAAQDPHHRVQGNALVALHRRGDPSAALELVNMSAHPAPIFRAVAAWAMGETEDPRFTEIVAWMLGDPSAPVRKQAFRAIARTKTPPSNAAPR